MTDITDQQIVQLATEYGQAAMQVGAGHWPLSTASCNYSVAFVNESDGSFDVVCSFAADSDDDANEFAGRNFPEQEWYVLDQHGRNINGW